MVGHLLASRAVLLCVPDITRTCLFGGSLLCLCPGIGRPRNCFETLLRWHHSWLAADGETNDVGLIMKRDPAYYRYRETGETVEKFRVFIEGDRQSRRHFRGVHFTAI